MASGLSILLSPQDRSARTRYGVPAVVLVLAACGTWLAPWSPTAAQFAFSVPAICVSAWFGGAGLGAAVTALGAALLALSIAPNNTWRELQIWLQLLLYLANGALLTALCAGLHRARAAGGSPGRPGSHDNVAEVSHEREEWAFLAQLQADLASAPDLDRCAATLAGALVPRVADWCSIHLVNEAGGLEPVHPPRDDQPLPPGLTGIVFPGGESGEIARRIVQAGESVFIPSPATAALQLLAADEAGRAALRAEGTAAFLGVPLRARGGIIGLLALATTGPQRALRRDDLRIVQNVAACGGLALDSAWLDRHAHRAHAAEAHARTEAARLEERFRYLWDASIFGMGTIAPTGRILTANAALARLLAYAPATIAAGAASLNERTASGWHAADARAGEELLRSGRCTPYEKDYLRSDGSTVHVLVCGMVLPQSDDCLMFVLDLTAQKHAEQALMRQSLLLKAIVETMPALVGYLDRERRLVVHNETCRQWLGVTETAIATQRLDELLGPATHERMRPYLQAAFRGRNMRHEFALASANRERHLLASYRPDRDAEGRVCGVVVHACDITERKEIEQALADALSRYRFLAEAMPQMVWTARPDGQFDYVNRRWLETTGMTEAAALAPDGWLEAVPADERVAVRRQWRHAVEACTPFERECRLRCGPEPAWRWHLIRALPRHDDHARVVQWVGSATDIDEQRRAYAELAEARERLRSYSEELEARVRARTATLREINAELEAFTYSVSHDLRTPLQFVRAFAEAIHTAPDATLSPEHRDHLQRIIHAAARMDTIIRDLLDYSRLTRADVQLVELPLDALVTDVLTHQQAAIRQSGARISVQRPLPVVCADATGLFQALSNLLSNALKFRRPGQPPTIRIRTAPTGQGVRLWVEDDGIGIDPRDHERIFKLFERLHSASEYPGTGIGLSLVRKAVHRMGATCGVESAPGQGSRFWIDFPDACALPSSHPANRPPSAGAARLRGGACENRPPSS